MALYDWNHNGEDDMMDNLIEYHIYRETMEKSEQNNYSSNNGSCSTIAAILLMMSGLIIQAVLYTVLGIDVENVPGFVMIILWIGIDIAIVAIMDKFGVL